MRPGYSLLLRLTLLLAGNAVQVGGLEWRTAAGFRWAELEMAPRGQSGFASLPPSRTGIIFTNILDEWSLEANRVLQNGSGVAIGDSDGDGWQDVFLCRLDGRNALYRNLGGWRFQEIAAAAGLAWTNRICRGAVFADIDGDRDLDLLVATTGEGVVCAVNDGNGRFTESTQNAGTTSKLGSVTMALADVDGNGTLDLYVANNRTDDIRDRGQINLSMVNGKLVIPPEFAGRIEMIDGRLQEYGEPDFLYLNDGRGHFTAISWTDGAFLDESGNPLTQPPLDWGLSVFMRDINADGAPDIYVCNDYWTPDRIWINDGTGRFRALNNLALRHTSASSMGADVADIDRDGHYDLFVVDMLSRSHSLRVRQMFAQRPVSQGLGEIDTRPQIMRNTLLRSRGDGTYEDIADFAGVSASEWSWMPNFLDIDLDGFEDVIIPSGHIKDVQDWDANEQIKAATRTWPQTRGMIEYDGKTMPFREAFVREKIKNSRFYPRLETPSVTFRNMGNLKFEDKTEEWGLDSPGIHHGMAMGDLDNDGDLDVVVNNLGSSAGIYRNESVAPRVAVRLKGTPPNTQGVGAHVRLLGGAVTLQSQEVVCGGRYLSGAEPMLVFAAGQTTSGMTLEVTWRGGKRSTIHNVAANRIYEVDEQAARSSESIPPVEITPFFRDVSNRLQHTHTEQPFNDFERQSLLPKRLSQLGPGASWFDIDADEHEDLIVGSGKGGQVAVYLNDGHGRFQRLSGAPFTAPVTRDQTTILGWRSKSGKTTLLAGSANYEDGLALGSGVRQYLSGQAILDDSLPATSSSTGPMALADLDGDGELELFVGGRVIGGRYPEPASSRIFKRDGQAWQLDQENSRLLENVGLVSGAVWSDLDSDGFPELVLACEWGPIRVFANLAGRLRERTKELGLDRLTGWWQGITAGDFDGDGDMDLMAGNWGLNSPYQASVSRPLRLFYGDFAPLGRVDLIETEYDEDSGTLVPRRMLLPLSASLPWLRERFPTHLAFSEASVVDALGQANMANAQDVQVTTLASTMFLNRGDRFEANELPVETQFAPAFAVNVADMDGDGREDIFLSQNFFDGQPEVPRLDAGRGLWLRNAGSSRFEAVSAQRSGVAVYGEQRGAALADFNEDGRTDLVVTQNGAETRLFQNMSAKPGLRVRLVGPPGNSTGVGAIIRLQFGERFGPAREIHAGSGYWSQDSAVQVLSKSETPTALHVLWPGGKKTITPLEKQLREISVNTEGGIVVSAEGN